MTANCIKRGCIAGEWEKINEVDEVRKCTECGRVLITARKLPAAK